MIHPATQLHLRVQIRMSNTKTIARNTGWYGIESAVSFGVTLFTSIAIARTLGPSRMGYVIYVTWVASIVSGLGGIGIPATTRKYMAEFLGMGDRGTARYIYFRTMLLQVSMATVATGIVLFWVLTDAPAEYRTASVLIALSIWPSMVNSISAQANVAREEMSANLPGSVISMIVFFLGIAGTMTFKWNVLGVGASMFLTRGSDFVIRFVPTFRRIRAWDSSHVVPYGLRKRMIAFAWQSVATMVVALIVWERSEFFLLKRFCSDIRQVAYYSVAFSMADRLLLPSTIFGSATGASIYAQYGRDKSRIPDIVASAFRYLTLTAIPLHFVFAALAVPTLLLLYGHQYNGAATVVTIAPILCMPKAFIGPAQDLLQSFERQSYVIVTTIVAGVIDIGVAWWLVRSNGAVGACIGSGVAQFTAVIILWLVVVRLFKVQVPWSLIGKIASFSVVAAIAIHLIVVQVAPLWALLGGGAAASILFVLFLYTMRIMECQDRERIKIVTNKLPRSIGRLVDGVVSKLIRDDTLIADTVAN